MQVKTTLTGRSKHRSRVESNYQDDMNYRYQVNKLCKKIMPKLVI